jgi:hypothetical protein
LIDGEDTHHRAAGTGYDPVGKISIGGYKHMTWQFTYWNLIRSFLELEHLLIHKLGLFVGNHIWVKGTLGIGLFTGLAFTTAPPGKCKAGETTFDPDILSVITRFAANVDCCCFGGYC